MTPQRSLFALFLAFLGACAPAPPDATELLRGMQLALLESDAYRYNFEFSQLSGGEAGAVEISGSVSLLRHGLSGGDYSARVQATTAGAEPGQAEEFVAVKTVDEAFVQDLSAGIVHKASMYSAGSQLVMRMEPALLYVLFDPNSLADEISAVAAWEGVTEVGGEACDLVRVTYDDDPEDSRWCIGRADSLPRRLEWIEAGEGTRLDLQEVETPTAFFEEFSFEVPDGYAVEVLEAGPPRGTAVPDLTLALAAGGELSIEELRGSVLVFDFWATWCAPCRASLAGLERTAQLFAGQPVRFFAVNSLESMAPGDPIAFAEENGLTTEVVLDGDLVHEFFAAGNLPALAVVDAQGRTQGVTIGFHGEGSELYAQELIRAALEATPD